MGLSRQHPFISPIGCGSALLVVIGVAVVALFSGGKEFSPGEVSALTQPTSASAQAGGFANHAEFEQFCFLCHAPFLGIRATLCEDCHTAVAEERATLTGLHGSEQIGDTARCQTCHREHEGREMNLMTDARQQFDHRDMAFSLTRHVRDYAQQPLVTQCDTCHTGAHFAAERSTCTLCHSAQNQIFMVDHLLAFGDDCLACHDGVDKQSHFDHGQTDFPLKALHAQVACAECHRADVPAADTLTACVACHAEPNAHLGMFGTDCAECHSPTGWSPATLSDTAFNHAQATGFALTSHTVDYNGAPFTCRACHSGGENKPLAEAFAFDQQTCVTCHVNADPTFMTEHTQQFGADCLSCHDGSGNMKNFDHANFFELDGQHATLECEQCHVEKKFKNTPKECVGCHAEPTVHFGVFGTDCAACHTTAAWTPARLTQHTFPLNHGEQGEVACATCHVDTYTTYTCYGCHEHNEADIVREHAEENIRGDRLANCMECHADGKEKEGND